MIAVRVNQPYFFCSDVTINIRFICVGSVCLPRFIYLLSSRNISKLKKLPKVAYLICLIYFQHELNILHFNLNPASAEFAEDLPAAGRCTAAGAQTYYTILQVPASTADLVKPALPESKPFLKTTAFMAASNRCMSCKYNISIIR